MNSPDKLNGLATAIAALATIYETDTESTLLARAIRDGGKELRFIMAAPR